jgi:hypothetical protein
MSSSSSVVVDSFIVFVYNGYNQEIPVPFSSPTTKRNSGLEAVGAVPCINNTWYLVIRDNVDQVNILKKALRDKDGNNITDLAAGILAQELKSDV